eukprot:1928328-Pleurochrysis_carterae.AAC.1
MCVRVCEGGSTKGVRVREHALIRARAGVRACTCARVRACARADLARVVVVLFLARVVRVLAKDSETLRRKRHPLSTRVAPGAVLHERGLRSSRTNLVQTKCGDLTR